MKFKTIHQTWLVNERERFERPKVDLTDLHTSDKRTLSKLDKTFIFFAWIWRQIDGSEISCENSKSHASNKNLVQIWEYHLFIVSTNLFLGLIWTYRRMNIPTFPHNFYNKLVQIFENFPYWQNYLLMSFMGVTMAKWSWYCRVEDLSPGTVIGNNWPQEEKFPSHIAPLMIKNAYF